MTGNPPDNPGDAFAEEVEAAVRLLLSSFARREVHKFGGDDERCRAALPGLVQDIYAGALFAGVQLMLRLRDPSQPIDEVKAGLRTALDDCVDQVVEFLAAQAIDATTGAAQLEGLSAASDSPPEEFQALEPGQPDYISHALRAAIYWDARPSDGLQARVSDGVTILAQIAVVVGEQLASVPNRPSRKHYVAQFLDQVNRATRTALAEGVARQSGAFYPKGGNA